MDNNKKYVILFNDATSPREFDPVNIDKVLEWAFGLENNTVNAIQTPHFILPVIDHETYKKALTAFDLAVV